MKDQQTFHDMPADVRSATEKAGEARTQVIYDCVRGDFWDWVQEAADRYGFDGVQQLGRSGGWLAVEGTGRQSFRNLLEPETAGDADDVDEARAEQSSFLAFAFEVVGAIVARKQSERH